MGRVPREVDSAYGSTIAEVIQSRPNFGSRLKELDTPLLLIEHEGCLAFTEEGWREMVMTFPDAMTASTPIKCSTSPAFAEALREFCAGLTFA